MMLVALEWLASIFVGLDLGPRFVQHVPHLLFAIVVEFDRMLFRELVLLAISFILGTSIAIDATSQSFPIGRTCLMDKEQHAQQAQKCCPGYDH